MSAVVYTLAIEARWRDMDAFNHVNNASYLGYIEEARVRWFKSLSADWANETSAPVMASVTVNYRRPAVWPETLRIELIAERAGNKSLTLGHRITAAGDRDVLYCDGHTILVWIDRSGQSVLLPENVRAACAVG
ncbi:acyl-CoA thioesterase [Arenimonas terrae]|uniref:Acyl-CoA thioesterase n=1 Tax=Arenimonas terrae TaxID=2546226 RepID=A0A5C4RWE4_9GAMM|nr:thioesterase family protein [Arenimonas terrae]TNJ35141.1 acyl-CoA thioesterase [Arenimonas terrae]